MKQHTTYSPPLLLKETAFHYTDGVLELETLVTKMLRNGKEGRNGKRGRNEKGGWDRHEGNDY